MKFECFRSNDGNRIVLTIGGTGEPTRIVSLLFALTDDAAADLAAELLDVVAIGSCPVHGRRGPGDCLCESKPVAIKPGSPQGRAAELVGET
jgi:hypothetical protein